MYRVTKALKAASTATIGFRKEVACKGRGNDERNANSTPKMRKDFGAGKDL